MLTNQEEVLISLSKLKGIGNVTLHSLLHIVESGASIDEVAKQSTKIAKAIDTTPDYLAIAEQDINACKKHDVSIISIFDSRFPKNMKADAKSPLLIYTKGDAELLNKPSLGIIGTRTPDRLAAEYAHRVSSHFAQRGIPILSGLALGCDTIAHESTLDAGGKAIAVIGHGLHMISPTKNTLLATNILSSGGVIVSEFPMGSLPSKFTYVQRDKTQASIAKAILLVQSSLEGGSLHACRRAIEVGKKVFVLPPTDSSVEDANSIIHNESSKIKPLLKFDDTEDKWVKRIKSKADYHLIDSVFS